MKMEYIALSVAIQSVQIINLLELGINNICNDIYISEIFRKRQRNYL